MFKYSLNRRYKVSIYSIYYRNKKHCCFPQGTVLKVEWILGGSGNNSTYVLSTTIKAFYNLEEFSAEKQFSKHSKFCICLEELWHPPSFPIIHTSYGLPDKLLSVAGVRAEGLCSTELWHRRFVTQAGSISAMKFINTFYYQRHLILLSFQSCLKFLSITAHTNKSQINPKFKSLKGI